MTSQPEPGWDEEWDGDCCYGNYDDAHIHGIAIGTRQERERMRAMRHDFQTLPHAEFPSKWPDWRDYEEVLPTYCGCHECRLWRSGS